jgi:hypothetical protein
MLNFYIGKDFRNVVIKNAQRKKMKNVKLMICWIIAMVCLNAHAQNYSRQAQIYFSKYLNSKTLEQQLIQSLPSLEDCKMVFKKEHSYTYFGQIEELKSQIKLNKGMLVGKELINFKGVKVNPFSTQDIELGKGNYAGGMADIADKLENYVVFYSVVFLKNKNDESGINYKYWVNINGRWVFFPAPYRYFSKNEDKIQNNNEIQITDADSTMPDREIPFNNSLEWTGKYVDNYGVILEIDGPRADGSVKFRFTYMNANCAEDFGDVAYLTSNSVANYKAEGDSCHFNFTFNGSTVEVIESDCSGYHGAQCGSYSGVFNRKNK